MIDLVEGVLGEFAERSAVGFDSMRDCIGHWHVFERVGRDGTTKKEYRTLRKRRDIRNAQWRARYQKIHSNIANRKDTRVWCSSCCEFHHPHVKHKVAA